VSTILIQAWHTRVKVIILYNKIVFIQATKLLKLLSKPNVSFANKAPGP
jgi:hypothetical protein